MTPDLNTILIALALAVLAWVGRTTQRSAVELAAINQRLVSGDEKMSRHDEELLALRVRITACEIELAKRAPR